MRKTIAIVTAMSFLVGIVYTPAYSSVRISSAAMEERAFSVPSSAGKVTGSKYFGNGDIIINIQDLHCHGEVQRNISKIIGHIDSSYGLEYVYLEGAYGNVDTTLLSNLRKSDLGAVTMEQMVDDGYLNGTEYYAAVNNKSKFIKGIEDKNIYERNLALLNEIIRLVPQIDAISRQLIYEIKPIRQEYANSDIKKLSRLVKRFEKQSISSGDFYSRLIELGKEAGIDVETKYRSINVYANLYKLGNLNTTKATEQFKQFINEVRNKISYGEYTALMEKSNSFVKIEEISSDLAEIDRQHNITRNNKQYHLQNFFKYLEFSREVNPMEFARDEKALKDELFLKYGRSIYEQEIVFLAEFIPTVKGYFTANITSEELETFNEDFKKFRNIWCSYFPENTAKKLDKYAVMLNEYHGNNVKRDEIFSKVLAPSPNIGESAKYGIEALKEISKEINGNNIKVVVTGGFHSKGLEKIFNDNRVNYVVITPNITKDTKEAHDIYLNIIKGYRSISKNTINTMPFMSEALNQSMPKLVATAHSAIQNNAALFKDFSQKDKQQAVVEFIEAFAAEHQKTGTGNVNLGEWTLKKFTAKEAAFSIEYKNKSSEESVSIKNYSVRDGKLIDIDIENETKAVKNGGDRVKDIKPLSILANFFNSVKFNSGVILRAFVMPVIEEIGFRYIPFTVASGLMIGTGNFAFAAVLAGIMAGFAGVSVAMHKFIDDINVKLNPLETKRSIGRMTVTSVLFAGVFMALSLAFPGIPVIALAAVTVMHILNNVLSLAGKIKNPIMSLIPGQKLSLQKERVLSPQENINQKLEQFINRLEYIVKEKEGFSYKSYTDDKQKDEFENFVSELRKINEYKDINEKFDATSKQLIALYKFAEDLNYYQKGTVILSILEPFAILGGYIKYNEETTLLEEVFLYLLDAGTKESFYGRVDTLTNMTAEIYKINPEKGYELLNELVKFRATSSFGGKFKSERILKMPDSITSMEQAIMNVPDGWKDFIPKEELEFFYESIGIAFLVPNYKSSLYDDIDIEPDYMQILKKLPADVREKIGDIFESVPIAKIKKQKGEISKDGEVYSRKFDAFSELLENNMLALDGINNANDDSIYDALRYLEAMINAMNTISEYTAADARIALNEIKKGIKKGITPQQAEMLKQLVEWSPDKIIEIRSVHSLINAVHQAAINSFLGSNIDKGKEKSSDIEGVKKIIVNPELEIVTAYDFSENDLSENVREFLSEIEKSRFRLRVLTKDGRFIWSKRPGEHSVDILIDLNDIGQGLRFSYNDFLHEDKSFSQVDGRMKKFEKTFLEMGMTVKTSVNGSNYRIYAVYGVKDHISAPPQYAEAFLKVLEAISQYADVFQGDTLRTPTEEQKHELKKQEKDFYNLPIETKFDMFQSFNKKAIEEVKAFFGIKGDLTKTDIVRMFVSDRITINEDTGILEMNENFSPVNKIIDAVMYKRNSTFEQAQLMNLLNYDEMNLTSVGYVGNMLAVNGIMKVKGGFLSINGIVDRERRRLKCVVTEFVTLDGTRLTLEYEELLRILKTEGYNVAKQNERSPYEKRTTINEMEKEISGLKDSREVRGMGISRGIGGYISGKVVYDRAKINEDSIWIVGYTTPDDVEKIKQTKGLVTTSGGQLSHANITARENKKTAVLLKETWHGRRIEAKYYTVSSAKTEKTSDVPFELQELSENKILVEEGTRILMNGNNGSVLIFNDIEDSILDELQDAIDNRNAEKLRVVIEANASHKNIGKIIEFVYFQSIENGELGHILKMLFAINGGSEAQIKITELNNAYINELLDRIDDTLANIREIDNVNISLNLVSKIEKELGVISIADKQNRIVSVRKKISHLKEKKLKEFDKYVKNFKYQIIKFNNKKELTKNEISAAMKLIDNAGAWRNFHGYGNIEDYVKELERKIMNTTLAKNGDTSEKILEKDVKGFDNISLGGINTFGAKTAHLASMYSFVKGNDYESIGISVPYGIGIGADVFEKMFFSKAGLTEQYLNVVSEFNVAVLAGNKDLASEKAKVIIDMIDSNDNMLLKEKIENMVDKNELQAVRGSAVGEDSSYFAYAGIGETYLNVSYEKVYSRMKDVWKSYFSERSIEYMIGSKNIIRPAILCQNLVKNVKKAGVSFTRDDTGDLTVEVAWGLGEGVVSGRIEPDHISVHLGTDGAINMTYRRAIGNHKKIVPDIKNGGIKTDLLTATEQRERILDTVTIERLYKIALKLEEDAGYPVDIEFAIDDNDNIFILQRRAITTFETSVVTVEPKQFISLTSRDVTKKWNHFAVVAHPFLPETPVLIYRGNTSNGINEFYIDAKYGDLAEHILIAFLEKVNKDEKLRKKFNAPIAFAKRADEGEIGRLPVNYDNSFGENIHDKMPESMKIVRELLSAA